MEDDSDRRESIDELLTRVDNARNEETRRAEIERVISQLEDLRSDEASGEVDYALAYAWYFHPCRSNDEAIQRKVSTLLLAATRRNPADFLAWLYLGHNAYDILQYGTALEYFNRAIGVSDADYLGLKAREMTVCCLMRSLGINAALDELERYVNKAEVCPAEDIWPEQLAAALKDKSREPIPFDTVRLTVLLERLDRAGRWGVWFQNLLPGNSAG